MFNSELLLITDICVLEWLRQENLISLQFSIYFIYIQYSF